LARRGEHPSFRVIPVFLPGAREQDTQQLPEFFEETQWIDFRSGLDDPDAVARLIAAVGGEVPYAEGRPNLSYLIRREARRWERSRREDDSLLYRGEELRRAQDWATQHPDEMNALVWDFLQASADLEEQERANREKRRRSIIVGLTIALAVTIVLAFTAWRQRNVALTAESTAVAEAIVRATAQEQAEDAEATAGSEVKARATAQTQAERQARIAKARALAAQSQTALALQRPQESLLLGI
jgi:hypothetical protein